MSAAPIKVRISFGGSHRKNRRCVDAMKPYLVENALILPRYQSKVLETTAFDSPEMREKLKALGGSVCLKQPEYLNKP